MTHVLQQLRGMIATATCREVMLPCGHVAWYGLGMVIFRPCRHVLDNYATAVTSANATPIIAIRHRPATNTLSGQVLLSVLTSAANANDKVPERASNS